MKLSQLLDNARLKSTAIRRVKGDIELTALKDDSRKVSKGDCFVAVRGPVSDGHDYIQKAIKSGAGSVICEELPAGVCCNIPLVLLKNTSKSLGNLAQSFYNWPADELTLCGVTGTKGKTTVTYILRSLLESAGLHCGLIGTILCDTLGRKIDSLNTTPGALTIAQILREMLDNGASAAVMEVSSHALDQNRCCGLDFNCGIFTNLSGEHLDYHRTLENYLSAKSMLFRGLKSRSVAVLNADQSCYDALVFKTSAKLLSYSAKAQAKIYAADIQSDYSGSSFTLNINGQSARVKSNLVGLHNVYNCLAAAGGALSAGLSFDQIVSGLQEKIYVPGRLEKLDFDGDFDLFVDYAHTDDALLNVLRTLRPLCRGKLIVLFGCGGDRDKTKRPRMARVAAEWADKIVITQDNPRTEDPQAIIDDIVEGFDKADLSKVNICPDRRQAIAQAIELASQGDIVLLAGKGHETYQIIGSEKTHFDDLEVAAEFLKA